ncbi:AAA family ATPase [Taibaiella helva]|uniref:AAA family ATPase n=1 Tax=Taibaiella helva TaxID=2301235 RepID=UPI000E574AFE|nr:AAA family ATPase [Taibaiella helva]
MATINEIAKQLKAGKQPIMLIYAFNSTGKTKLSVEYKNITKQESGKHSGVYYNAYSEDLFRWDNDEENGNENMRLEILKSSLNPYFSSIIENPDLLDVKLAPYLPKYTYAFDSNSDPEIGIDAVRFSREEASNIKISRGEERIFIWCFFLALFEADAWTGEQDAHFFIDDPVSSMDDHNIFLTANSIIKLIDDKVTAKSEKRIIITTHHVGLFSILSERLKYSTHGNNTKRNILSFRDNELTLKNHDKDVFLYHLHLIQVLKECIDEKKVMGYHFILLRQLLEIISSFLGTGGIQTALKEIGYKEDLEMVSNRVNSLSHKDGRTQPAELERSDAELLEEIYREIQSHYNFITH